MSVATGSRPTVVRPDSPRPAERVADPTPERAKPTRHRVVFVRALTELEAAVAALEVDGFDVIGLTQQEGGRLVLLARRVSGGGS